MGQVFNTSFNFQGTTYTAIAKVMLSGSDINLNVHVPDKTLHHLLPEGNIKYHSREGFSQVKEDERLLAQELVGCIIRSVEKHLND